MGRPGTIVCFQEAAKGAPKGSALVRHERFLMIVFPFDNSIDPTVFGEDPCHLPDSLLTVPQSIRTYWENLRCQSGCLPDRRQLDPRGIADALGYCFIGERLGRGVIGLRFAGAGLAGLCGDDMEGMPLSILFASDSRPALAMRAEEVFLGQRLVHMRLHSARAIGQNALTGTLLMLPVRQDVSADHLILGCLVATKMRGTAPRKFTIVDSIGETLARAMPDNRHTMSRRTSHLRLVHSTDQPIPDHA